MIKFRNIPVDGELVAADDVELVEGEFVVEEDVVVPEEHSTFTAQSQFLTESFQRRLEERVFMEGIPRIHWKYF